MAKKVSKHSRAARRGYEEESNEAKELGKLPKRDSYEDDVKKSIIRSNIINENLLAKKMEKKKITKRKTNTIRQKSNRFNTTSGILNTKIDQSIARHNFIQQSRKSGWDKINEQINSNKAHQVDENANENDENDENNNNMDEDEQLLQEYFQESNQQGKNESNGSSKEKQMPQNKFNLLEEAEA